MVSACQQKMLLVLRFVAAGAQTIIQQATTILRTAHHAQFGDVVVTALPLLAVVPAVQRHVLREIERRVPASQHIDDLELVSR